MWTEKKVEGMKTNKRWMILAVLFLVLNMAIATQYATTKVGYEYYIIHPSNASIRLIGSDNSSDGIRILRVIDSNVTDVGIKLKLGGNFTTNEQKTYSAAFGIVNEGQVALNITHINVSSLNATYLKIWLHGNRTQNAESTDNDPSSVYMWNNDTLVNASDTIAWTLAAGDDDPDDMCSNVSDRPAYSANTPWDQTAHVRYSRNNTNATDGFSDYVWVQIAIDIPETADSLGIHTGTIWLHFESEDS